MDRLPQKLNHHSRPTALGLLACLLFASVGCVHQIAATGIYLLQGGNLVDPECDALENQKVVVFCRPPLSSEYSHAGASRSIARQVSRLLREKVPGIKVVDPREVDNWLDENDSDDYQELGQAVGADLVVRIELDSFDLFNGTTLYQGNADVKVAVYDISSGGELIWDREMGEVRFPSRRSGGIPAQDKPVRDFQRQYVTILSAEIARNFHKYDPHSTVALDAIADR